MRILYIFVDISRDVIDFMDIVLKKNYVPLLELSPFYRDPYRDPMARFWPTSINPFQRQLSVL